MIQYDAISGVIHMNLYLYNESNFEQYDATFMSDYDGIIISYDWNNSFEELINNNMEDIKNNLISEALNILNINKLEDMPLEKLTRVKQLLKVNNYQEFLNLLNTVKINIFNVNDMELCKNVIISDNLQTVLDFSEFVDINLYINELKKIDQFFKLKNINVTYITEYTLTNYQPNGYSLNETVNLLETVNSTINYVKKYNLSPLEQTMFVYDIVRQRKYKLEEKGENQAESRDATRVLEGNSIVCEGFSSLIRIFLDKLNIKNSLVYLYPKKGDRGHVRNVVYLEDDKYKVYHAIFLDATGDYKKDETNNYLNSYYFFGRNKNFFYVNEEEKYNEQFFKFTKDELDDLDNYVGNICIVFNKIIKNINLRKFLVDYDKIDEDAKNTIIEMFDNNFLYYSIINSHVFEKHKKDLYLLCNEIMNRKLDRFVFMKALYNTRRVEHYIDPDKYILDFDNYSLICRDYYLRHIDDNVKYKRVMILQIFGLSTSVANSYFKEEELEIIREKSIEEDKNNYDDYDISISEFVDTMEIDINRINSIIMLKQLRDKINENDIDPNTSVKDAIKIMKK